MPPEINTSYKTSQFINLLQNEDIAPSINKSAAVSVSDSAFINKAQKVSKAHKDATLAANASFNPELREPTKPATAGSAQEALDSLTNFGDDEFMTKAFANVLVDISEEFLAAIDVEEFLNNIVDDEKREGVKKLLESIKTDITKLVGDLKSGITPAQLADRIIPMAQQLLAAVSIAGTEKLLSKEAQGLLASIEKNLAKMIDDRDADKPMQLQIVDLLCKLMMMLLVINEAEARLSATMSKIAYASAQIEVASLEAEAKKMMGSAISGTVMSAAGFVGTLGLQQWGLKKERATMKASSDHMANQPGMLSNIKHHKKQAEYYSKQSRKTVQAQEKAAIRLELEQKKDGIIQPNKIEFKDQKETLKNNVTNKNKDAIDDANNRNVALDKESADNVRTEEKKQKNGADDKKIADDIATTEQKHAEKTKKWDESAKDHLDEASKLTKDNQAKFDEFAEQGKQAETIRTVVQAMGSQMAVANLVSGISTMLTKQENAIQTMARQDVGVHDKVADSSQQNAASARALVDRIKELLDKFLNSKNETAAFVANHIKG